MRHWKVFLLTAACLLAAGCGAADKPQPTQEEAARIAYSSLLSGDGSLLDDSSLGRYWEDFLFAVGDLEYIFLDLDGDGVCELLVQWEDFPGGYNAVFHYGNGVLSCWQNDSVEMVCRDYPLQDGTMVRQYDYGGGTTYTLFRYQTGGEEENIACLYARTSPSNDGDLRPCPYYEVDGEEVDETVFGAHLDELVTGQMLDRSAWTPIEHPDA